jgi:glycosyltransferase involved in cell wall biosynthesis
MISKIGNDAFRNGGNTINCKISVIIPVFNVEKYLRRCVDSVLAQTFRDFEIILVDDCSPDGSPAICEEYAQKDRRITVIHNAKNEGSSQTRKVGLEAAHGDYILFVDSDDWIESNMLELLYNKAIDDDLDMVCCLFYRNTDTKQSIIEFPFLDDKIEMIKEIAAWTGFSPSVWNKLIKNEICQKINFPTAGYGEDRQIVVQAIHYASRIGYVKTALYHYYSNSSSWCNSSSKVMQRYADEYEIALWVIKFLHNNYSGYFDIFEPELSAYINSLKLHFVQEKPIRDISKLRELYPVSDKQIFNTAWNGSFCNKILLFLAVNHFSVISYFFTDMINFIKMIFKIVYRLLIPANIRHSIWKKRNIKDDL